MAGIEWSKVRGFDFTPEEAKEASDFVEVVANYCVDIEFAYNLLKEAGRLSTAKRLVFAERIPLDRATILLLCDPDVRIRGIVSHRLNEERDRENGGIIITGQ